MVDNQELNRVDVSRDRLLGFLENPGELDYVDFKGEVPLSRVQSSGRAESGSGESRNDGSRKLARAVAAFSDKGGWILVGVANDGTVVGVPSVEIPHWDESRLRARLERYLSPGFRLCTATHEIETPSESPSTRLVVILQVLPHLEGACIVQKDIELSNGKNLARAGDILTRKDSQSTRADQRDLARIINKRARLVGDAETAAIAARKAVFSELGTASLDKAKEGHLWMRMGWAASSRPADLTRQIFYATKQQYNEMQMGEGQVPWMHNFETWLWQLLEAGLLRRSGHVYENTIRRTSDMLGSSGRITHHGDSDTDIDVRVHVDGRIAVAAAVATTDWTPDELFSWWIFGADWVAREIMTRLNLGGNVYACLRYSAFEWGEWGEVEHAMEFEPSDPTCILPRKLALRDMKEWIQSIGAMKGRSERAGLPSADLDIEIARHKFGRGVQRRDGSSVQGGARIGRLWDVGTHQISAHVRRARQTGGRS